MTVGEHGGDVPVNAVTRRGKTGHARSGVAAEQGKPRIVGAGCPGWGPFGTCSHVRSVTVNDPLTCVD